MIYVRRRKIGKLTLQAPGGIVSEYFRALAKERNLERLQKRREKEYA